MPAVGYSRGGGKYLSSVISVWWVLLTIGVKQGIAVYTAKMDFLSIVKWMMNHLIPIQSQYNFK